MEKGIIKERELIGDEERNYKRKRINRRERKEL